MKKNPIALMIMGLISFVLLLPLVLTFFYSIFSEWNSLKPTGFTLSYYAQLFTDQRFLSSLGRTVLISIFPIVITAIIILLAMFVVMVYLPQLEKYMQMLCMIPYTLQGVILGTSILGLYSGVDGFLGDRKVMLIAAYCIVILPYMYQGIRNSLEAVDATNLLEAAQMLGVTKFYGFFRIIVPNILSGITISSMLSMAIIFGDFAIVNVLAGSYYETTQVYLQKKLFESGQISSATIIVLFIVTLLISLGVFLMKKKDKVIVVEEEK